MKNLSDENKNTNIWQVQEAEAKFSQLVDDANEKGYQVITKNGESVAVMLSKKEFDKITQSTSSLIDFFKTAPCQDVDLDINRSHDLPKEVDL